MYALTTVIEQRSFSVVLETACSTSEVESPRFRSWPGPFHSICQRPYQEIS